MSKLVFVEANTSGTGMLALTRAVDWGLNPVFYTNNPDRYIDLHDIDCEIHICDTNDIARLRHHIEHTQDIEMIGGITTTSEFYLEQVASLTTAYQLPGNTLTTVRKVRNKAQTRTTLQQHGILQPQFEVVRHSLELKAAIENIGLPCIVKPTEDSGSNGVRLCFTLDTAIRHMDSIVSQKKNVRDQITPNEIIVEQYIQAPEYSVETISWQGHIQVIGITQKSLVGLPFFVESGHTFPAQVHPKQYKAIIDTVVKALQAVRFYNGAAHTEVKWTNTGCSIIEINGRLAGGMIPELIRLTTGVDMLKQHILCALGGPNLSDITYKGIAGIRFLVSDIEGQVQRIIGIDQALELSHVKNIQVNFCKGQHVSPPQNAYHRLGYVIAHGNDSNDTNRILDNATELIQIIVE